MQLKKILSGSLNLPVSDIDGNIDRIREIVDWMKFEMDHGSQAILDTALESVRVILAKIESLKWTTAQLAFNVIRVWIKKLNSVFISKEKTNLIEEGCSEILC